ncbi:MAG TPA: DUF4185 domain-containing protein [Bacteroidales bacterium]
MSRKILLIISIFLFYVTNCFSYQKLPKELHKILKKFPSINEFLLNSTFDTEIRLNKQLALYRFIDNSSKDSLYVAWSRTQAKQKIEGISGFFWVFDTAQIDSKTPIDAANIQAPDSPIILFPAASHSPIIDSVFVEGLPIEPIPTDGDLWFSTWAGDDNVYSGWGDGKGPLIDKEPVPWVDCGVVRLTGDFPYISAKTMYRGDLTPPLEKNDKPSSFIYFDSCLYGQFHSPLGDARIGYLSRSSDFGATWKRIGYFDERKKCSDNASPWTKANNSPFRCMFFINMGKEYNLNNDEYVYALGIGKEWHWMSLGVYLTRVKKDSFTKYEAYEYFRGLDEMAQPIWSKKQEEASPLKGLITMGQGSAIYHPGINRFLFMTDKDLFDAPNPWGPWTYAGSWTSWMNQPGRKEWQGGYQPGIISKDISPNSFWFTVSGQNKKPYITYTFNLGKMIMVWKCQPKIINDTK